MGSHGIMIDGPATAHCARSNSLSQFNQNGTCRATIGAMIDGHGHAFRKCARGHLTPLALLSKCSLTGCTS
eukprot:5970487-Alexandrium_andersonii.AAC.1